MPNTLANIELPPGARWVNRDSWIPIRMNKARTSGGGIGMQHQPLFGGRPITLELRLTDWPLFSRANVDATIALASTAGASFVLSWDGVLYTVGFDLTQSDAVKFEPVYDLSNLQQCVYTGVIKLLTL